MILKYDETIWKNKEDNLKMVGKWFTAISYNQKQRNKNDHNINEFES